MTCLVAIAACLSALLTRYVRRYAVEHSMLDVPNLRSSHETPTPRGGGLAIAITTISLYFAMAISGNLDSDFAAAVIGSGLIVASVGYADDLFDVSVGSRLLLHILAAVWVLMWGGGLGSVSLPFGELTLGWASPIFAIGFMVWLINLYNFMDGIDGLASVEAVTVGLSAAILVALNGDIEMAVAIAIVSAASAGFLIWNWPPAKIFMGDVGSGFLGCVFAAAILLTHPAEVLSLWAWMILLGVFIVDATMTLARRFFRYESIHQAHRSHAYQHAARRFGSHRNVTVAVGSINMLWLFPLAWSATNNEDLGIFLVGIAWAPLIVLAVCLGAGAPK